VSPWQRSTRLRIALPVKDKSRFRQSWMWRCIGIFRLGRKLDMDYPKQGFRLSTLRERA
jgi:hypothetical protein